MKNWNSPGEHVAVTVTTDVASGAFVKIGALTGVAQGAAAAGEDAVLVRRGVFDLPKVAAEAWSTGAQVYWNEAEAAMSTVADGNTLAGVALAAAAGGAATGRVLLDGTIR